MTKLLANRKIDDYLDSREVAKMIEKRHKNFLRDIEKYITDLTGSNLSPLKQSKKINADDFFIKTQYKDSKGEKRPCYLITKKGCDFIAHKMKGAKGTLFTALYIDRFYKLENIRNEKGTTEWKIQRNIIKTYSEFMNKTIRAFTKYSIAHGQDPKKASFNYINFNRLINQYADVLDRDYSDIKAQLRLAAIISMLDTYINTNMNNNAPYHLMYNRCKELLSIAQKRDILKIE